MASIPGTLGTAGSPLAAQASVAGVILEDSTGRPLAGAEVAITTLGKRTATNERGRYFLTGLAPGMRLLRVRSVGYHPVSVMVHLQSGDTLRRDISLSPAPPELDPIVVTAEPRGPLGIMREAFEERRKMGFGKFLDSTELKRYEHLKLPDVLARTGIRFVKNGPEILAVSRRRPDGLCYMNVVVDGVALYVTVAPAGADDPLRKPPPDLLVYDVHRIESIEVYRGAAEIPTEFGGAGGGCGVIVIWTKRG